ncbi:MAG: PDZ domain-containing protein [Acidobacteria bacterium]|nr:PDZ domain-containing protein [Acidobacteriota bacterium]
MSFATQARAEVSTRELDSAPSPMLDRSESSAPNESRWLVWGRSVFAVGVALALLTLGLANIALYSRWHEVEDGVHWDDRPEGVTAVEIAAGSAAASAGLQRGDVLVAINGVPVQTRADVIEYQHQSQAGTRLSYTLLRLGTQQALELSLVPSPRGSSMYFVLAAVGLFTLLVGASVRLRRPRDQATLHFFWLCVAFFGVFTFSFSGPFDRLDWAFYWGDAIAFALLPPLLLHFTIVFPERPSSAERLALWMYLPALGLGAARVIAIVRGSQGTMSGRVFSRVIQTLDRLEPIYLFVCAVAAVAILVRAFQQITSVTARRQLRWIAWGTALGVGPFAFGYALPWALGVDPPFALQLTAIPLGLVPLAFACAIVRYRLRDVEVIIKHGLVYATFLAASITLYFGMRKAVGFVFENDRDGHNWIVALLATTVIVVLLKPVKDAVQNALDRVFYRDRYDYRRALVAFARDLNSDLDVVRLSQRLVARIVETLVVDRMALMLAPGDPGDDARKGHFTSLGAYGFAEPVPRLSRTSSLMGRLDSGHTVALDDPIAGARFVAEEVEFWRDAGIFYFVPCVFEGRAIAVLALGRKETDEPFNSEDLALLTAVAGQVATAIENGRLFRQLHQKAEEIGRMREFNENILESLDDGLVVFDAEERIVRWNRALESFYGVAREAAVGARLGDVFDAPFVEALRAARIEHPYGATLHRVPLSAPSSDASRLLVNATEVPLQNSASDDEVLGTLLLIEDITDQVRMEEQLQISEKMASIGLLAAGVAHEVNTPLTGISSFTQMLLEGANPADPRTTLLEKIERQTFRAAKIVNGLLNLSRPGTSSHERIDVDLNAVITDVFSLLEHQFEVGSIKVRRELAPGQALVLGIEHQLQQVFLNLFLNARDAMPSGGWLSVSTRIEDEAVVAEIADTGSGIPSEQLARIYDPFFTTKAIGRGTGLGLSITYGIMREHEGSIHCDSAVGQGTRFTLTLPLAPGEVRRARAQ